MTVTAIAPGTNGYRNRDYPSLFELDDRLIELMDQVEEAAEAGTEITPELSQEIDTYLDAYRHKVDRIVGYWRWQQSIADIASKEADRLTAGWPKLALPHGQPPAHQSAGRPAPHSASRERRPAAFAADPVMLDHALGLEVDDG